MSDEMCCPLSSSDADDGPEFWSECYVVARKPHKCCECREEISKGQAYHRCSGKWDGHMRTYRTCAVCAEIRDHFDCGEGYYFERLWDDLGDNFLPTMTAGGRCMEGLSPQAKAKLFEACLKQKGFYN